MSDNTKMSRQSVFFIGAVAVCMLVIGYFLLTSGSGDNALQVDQMQEMTQQVAGMEKDVKKKEGEVMRLVDQYETKSGKKVPIETDTLALTDAERELLEQQIGDEKDVSLKALLQDILKKKDEIDFLQEKIANIEELLPTPHIAQKGESHYQIALDFLVNEKGLEPGQAAKLLARTALFEELAEGFKIWNFYTGQEYGTSVTQGSANVSPNTFVHRAKKKLVEEKEKAIYEKERLAENMKTMEEEQTRVNTRLDLVTQEKDNLENRVNTLDKQVNSMYYVVDSQKNLKKKGIIKSGFLSPSRLKDASPDHFDRSLDLGIEDQLVISAEDLGVDKIKNVTLYPRFYKKGESYKVLITSNNKHALLTLMDKSKFKSERVVISVK